MELEFVPLLRIHRDLYRMPRGMERFRAYLKTMVDAETGDLALPLIAMNPMGKDHVPALLDTLLELQADDIGEVLTSIHRAAYIQRHGAAKSLADTLRLEGTAMAAAGCVAPALESEDLTYTRTILEPLLEATDRATLMACLFGDAAASALGYRAQGLSHRAGLALALQQVRSSERLRQTARG
jgi:hypothetical protein